MGIGKNVFMNSLMSKWISGIGRPEKYDFQPSVKLLEKYDFPECDAELRLQANGPGTFQRVLTVFPKRFSAPAPAVAVPFYFSEGMMGFELDSRKELPFYAGIEMMLHLVRRGFVAASADAYHLTYLESPKERGDFTRWPDAGEALRNDHPGWTGIGKLVADTRLLIDLLAADSRVDAGRIGIAGHSLGGKMAFYTGCLDSRVRAILASDFGIGWEQSNWGDIWYWGDKLSAIRAAGMEHSELLTLSEGKPFFLIAGKFDNDESLQIMRRAHGYESAPERLGFLNHATGHRPPQHALETGYRFLEKWLAK